MTVCAACGHDVSESAKFCPECGAPLARREQSREQRKTVTVLFCDVADSTALGESTDPEALRSLLARYFERMKAIVERHGGTVEKFIGDAVMAVFGVPVVHEDDALRACRAAVEMRDSLPELGIRGRIGVNTGEVVTGTDERLATGDAVNVAARLEQAAEPGAVLIGDETRRLVRDAVELGESRSLELKGKSGRVAAHPLLAVVADGGDRRFDVDIVGRERELRALDDAWQRALSERACHLFTVLGAAGVGKSRLTAEFLARLDGTRVLRGRCLSYGEGITYWPVVEMMLQLGERPADPRAAAAITGLLGESDSPATSDEIAWAFRVLLEQVAPVVCVIDDLHWAEPTLLDLVDHVADWSRDAPILVLCIARPELLDRRRTWAGGKLNATTTLLEPLTSTETDVLIERLLGDAELEPELRGRIAAAAEGNPLFVEQMLAMLAESPSRDVVVPPTIHALLAARLDQLELAERDVLQRGAVEGKIFHRGGVEALAPGEADIPQRLQALVRKELVRPERAQLAGDEAFRFRHLLIRDAAYDALPKSSRAELHERFAEWLGAGVELVELDEIVGYHLEQAHRYRVELGLDDERTRRLGALASQRLAASGTRAFERLDMAAAVGLLERAVALVPEDERSVDLESLLVHTRMQAGDLAGATALADELVERAQQAGDRPRELRALLVRSHVSFLAEGASAELVRPVIEEALEVFAEADDAAGLAEAWDAVMRIEHNACRFRRRLEALEHVIAYAERAGATWLARAARGVRAASYLYGPFPVEQAIAWMHENADTSTFGFAPLGTLEAARGDFAAARAVSAAACERARELGHELVLAGLAMQATEIELLADEPARAAEAALAGVAALEKLGERGWLSTVAAFGAEALYRVGRDDEAWRLTDKAEAAAATDDVATQMVVRQVRGKLLARQGELDEALRLGREAVALGEPTDMLDIKATARVDLATILAAAGLREEAAAELAAGRELYEAKGHTVGVARVDRLLAEQVATLP